MISDSFLIRMGNVSNKSYRQNQNTHFIPRVRDDVEKYGTVTPTTDDNTIRRMCIACLISKATKTHSEYVILIVFSVTTVVTRTRLIVTFKHALPVLFFVFVVFLCR